MDKNNVRARKNGSTTGDTTTIAPTGAGTTGTGRADGAPTGTIDLTTAGTATAATRGAAPPEGERSALPQALHDTFVDDRNDVLTVINELEDQLDRHQEIRETLERQLADTTEKLQTANQRTQELEWQAVSLQTRVDALEQGRQEITLLEEELNDANQRVQRLTEQTERTDKEYGKARNDLKIATKQLEELWSLRKERDGLKADTKTLSTKVDELERTLRDGSEERAVYSGKLNELTATLEETRAERHQLQISLRSAEDRVRELLRVQEALTDKLESVRTEKKAAQATIAHLERENARLIEQRQFFECELTSLRNMNRTAETALTSVKKAFAEVRVALSETKARARRRTIDTWPRIGTTLRGRSEPIVTATATADADFGSLLDEAAALNLDPGRPHISESISVGGTLRDDT